MGHSSDSARALTWIANDVMPHVKEAPLRVAFALAIRGHVSAPGTHGLPHEQRAQIAPSTGLSSRTVLETLGHMVDSGLVISRREFNQVHYLLNLNWRPTPDPRVSQ